MAGADDGAGARVLLVRRGYLGDVLLLSRACAALRSVWSDAHIAIACNRGYVQAVELIADADEALGLPESAGEWWAFWRRLRAGRFTHVMDYDNRSRTALVTLLSGAGMRVGFPIGKARRTARFVYHRMLEMPGAIYAAQHMSENYLWAWREAGVALPSAAYRLRVPEAQVGEVRARIAGTAWGGVEKRDRAIIHVGTRSEHRRWPLENFAEAARRLARSEPGLRFAVVGGPGDEAALATMGALLPDALGLGVVGDVRLLAGWLAEASDFLGHDSGPAHLAAGLGLRIVTLATTPDSVQWRPLAEKVRVLAAPSPCPQCLAPGVCVPPDTYRMRCVGHVTVEAVVRSSRELRVES